LIVARLSSRSSRYRQGPIEDARSSCRARTSRPTRKAFQGPWLARRRNVRELTLFCGQFSQFTAVSRYVRVPMNCSSVSLVRLILRPSLGRTLEFLDEFKGSCRRRVTRSGSGRPQHYVTAPRLIRHIDAQIKSQCGKADTRSVRTFATRPPALRLRYAKRATQRPLSPGKV
jgi:hypothetical protein